MLNYGRKTTESNPFLIVFWNPLECPMKNYYFEEGCFQFSQSHVQLYHHEEIVNKTTMQSCLLSIEGIFIIQ